MNDRNWLEVIGFHNLMVVRYFNGCPRPRDDYAYPFMSPQVVLLMKLALEDIGHGRVNTA